jgi:AhpC/TSA family
MKTMKFTLLSACALLAAAPAAFAAPAVVGQPAPAFSVADASGKTVSLADYKGKTVVLEWVNPGCPYVRKHYDSANMQTTQKGATGQGVVWLAVNSTAQGHYDYKKPAEMTAWMTGQKAAATHTLMDSDGKTGKAYGARTTPHLYIVDAKGTLGQEPCQCRAGRHRGGQAGRPGRDAALRLLGQVRRRLIGPPPERLRRCPLKGATPAARRSRFHGVCWPRHACWTCPPLTAAAGTAPPALRTKLAMPRRRSWGQVPRPGSLLPRRPDARLRRHRGTASGSAAPERLRR